MKTTPVEIASSIDALLDVLDADIRQLRKSLDTLNELRALVVKRDDKLLQNLLLSVRTDSQQCGQNESKRQSIRQALAQTVGCSLSQITLSRLQQIAPADKSSRISDIADNLRTLSTMLKKEYAATTALLADCARFNRQLLQCILSRSGGGSMTYKANGSARRHIDAAFMNLKF